MFYRMKQGGMFHCIKIGGPSSPVYDRFGGLPQGGRGSCILSVRIKCTDVQSDIPKSARLSISARVLKLKILQLRKDVRAQPST